MADGNRTRFVKLIVLEFFFSSIYLSPRAYLEVWSTDRSFWPQASIILGSQETEELTAEEYIGTLGCCEDALTELQHLSEAVNFVIDMLLREAPAMEMVHVDRSNSKDTFQTIDNHVEWIILQRLCHQRCRNVERYIERLNRRFEGQNKYLNIRESKSVKTLTVLATIFLPLSLSTSILSMQTRFVDLNLLLYDFLGVFVIIGSLAVIMLLILKLVFRVRTQSTFLSMRLALPRSRKDQGRTCFGVLSTYYAMIWAIVIVSFVVGMTLDVIKGLKILGYGFAGMLGFVPIFLIHLWVINTLKTFHHYREMRGANTNESLVDLEREQGQLETRSRITENFGENSF